PARGPLRQREVEDDEDGDDEEEHRGQRLPRAQLEQEILARERADVREVPHARARRVGASRSTRAGSGGAARNGFRPPSSAAWAARSAGPCSSSAVYGSSRT